MGGFSFCLLRSLCREGELVTHNFLLKICAVTDIFLLENSATPTRHVCLRLLIASYIAIKLASRRRAPAFNSPAKN